MAAEYGININVRTKDEQLKRLQKELTKADATVKKLANSLERIEKKGKAGSGRPGGPFSAEAIDIKKNSNDIFNSYCFNALLLYNYLNLL